MINNIKFWLYSLIILGFVIILFNCKKDETKIDPLITWENPADIGVVTLLGKAQLNAKANVPGVFVYTPALGTQLNIGANQDLKAEFFPTDFESYNKTSKTVKINVTASTTIADIDGNIYNTITIGNQIWTVENMKVTHYRDGTEIPYVTEKMTWSYLTTDAYCDYDNLESNSDMYGRLYNWYAINTGILAPEGWHVPTDAEWTLLENYVISNSGNLGSLAKALASNTQWPFSSEKEAIGNDLTKNNRTGFTALPGGYRHYGGNFYFAGRAGFWWRSDDFFPGYSYGRDLFFDNSIIGIKYYSKRTGFSIRCVRD